MSSHTVISSETVSRDQSDRANRCAECGVEFRIEGGETFCPSCGTVVDVYRIDHGPEWNAYNERARRRTGAPLTETLHDRGLSTDIGRRVDGQGNGLSGETRRRFHRLRREHGRARFSSKAERNLGHGFDEIRRLKGGLDLPDAVSDRACSIYRAASRADLLRGRSIESMAAASVYVACREYGLPWRLDEIEAFARTDADRIHGDSKALKRELGLHTPPLRPRDVVHRLASALEVPNEIRGRAYELVMAAEEAGIATGKKPSGVAAACVYHAAAEVGFPVTRGTKLTQNAVATAAGVTDVTLRNCWTELRELSS